MDEEIFIQGGPVGQLKSVTLCDGCHKNGGKSASGQVRCEAAGRTVVPVTRQRGQRFEDCQHRAAHAFGRPVLSSELLKKLHTEAVKMRTTFPNQYHPVDTVAHIEQRLLAESEIDQV